MKPQPLPLHRRKGLSNDIPTTHSADPHVQTQHTGNQTHAHENNSMAMGQASSHPFQLPVPLQPRFSDGFTPSSQLRTMPALLHFFESGDMLAVAELPARFARFSKYRAASMITSEATTGASTNCSKPSASCSSRERTPAAHAATIVTHVHSDDISFTPAAPATAGAASVQPSTYVGSHSSSSEKKHAAKKTTQHQRQENQRVESHEIPTLQSTQLCSPTPLGHSCVRQIPPPSPSARGNCDAQSLPQPFARPVCCDQSAVIFAVCQGSNNKSMIQQITYVSCVVSLHTCPTTSHQRALKLWSRDHFTFFAGYICKKKPSSWTSVVNSQSSFLVHQWTWPRTAEILHLPSNEC